MQVLVNYSINMKVAIRRAAFLMAVCIASYYLVEAPYWTSRYFEEHVNKLAIHVVGSELEHHNHSSIDSVNCAGAPQGAGFPRYAFRSSTLTREQNILFCTIYTGRSQKSGLPDDVPALVHASGVPIDFERQYQYSFSYYFLGSSKLAQFIARVSWIFFCLAVYHKLYGWREDFLCFRSGAKAVPYVFSLPMFCKFVGLLLGSIVSNLKLSRGDFYSFFDSLVYAPIVEEIIFRFLLFSLVARYSNVLFSALFTSWLFAIGHGYDLTGTMSVAFSGLAFQYLYIRYKSIGICIVAHMIINLAITAGNNFLGG